MDMPMHEPELIKNFMVKWVHEWHYSHKTNLGNPSFVNTPALRDWMHRRPADGSETNFKRILNTIPLDQKYKTKFPSSHELEVDFAKKGSGITLVLANLIKDNHHDFLYGFKRCEVNDESLKDIESLRKSLGKLPSYYSEKNRPTIMATVVESFCDGAGMFNPVIFDFDPANLPLPWQIKHPKTSVLPYCMRDKLGSQGATADVYEVLVPQELVAENMRKHLPPPLRWSRSPNHDSNQVYAFVVKTYRMPKHCKRDYENECEAFRGLQNGVTRGGRRTSSMIRFFTCFEHTSGVEGKEEKTYNILLEAGWKDLMEHYQYIPPPQHKSEIISSWERILNIAQSLLAIHSFEYVSHDGSYRQTTFHGLHGDIKPDNILIVEERYVEDTDSSMKRTEPHPHKLKLADFGFAQFIEHQGPGKPLMKIDNFTDTYGAPELHKSESVSQAIDVWSFGCVLSVHATWIVKGPDDIQTFATLRHLGASPKGLKDAFHDGREVLKEVKLWHEQLKKHLRDSDNITKNILNVADKLLVASPEDRLKPSTLCQTLSTIIDNAKREAQNDLSAEGGTAWENIKKALAKSESTRQLPSVSSIAEKVSPQEPSGTIPSTLRRYLNVRPKGNSMNRRTSELDPQRLERYRASNLTRSMEGPSPETTRAPPAIPGPSGTSRYEEGSKAEVEHNRPTPSVDLGPVGKHVSSPAAGEADETMVSTRVPLNAEGPESNVDSSTLPYPPGPNPGNRPNISAASGNADAGSPNVETPVRIVLSQEKNKSFMDILQDEDERSVKHLKAMLDQYPRIAFGKDKDRKTSIMFAARHCSLNKFEILFEHYKSNEELAMLSDKDREGQTVLHHLTNNPSTKTVQHGIGLIARYCRNILDEGDKSEKKPIYWAFYRQNRHVLEALLEAGAKLELSDFLKAVKRGDKEGVEYLCDEKNNHIPQDRREEWIKKGCEESEIVEMKTLLKRHLEPVRQSWWSRQKNKKSQSTG